MREVTRPLVLALALAFGACGGGGAKHPKTGKPGKLIGRVQDGLATWYVDDETASGERYSPNKLTAAHLTLPMQTRVRVTNKRNGKSVVVRINDRGPFGNKKRIIDVSKEAARRLDMIEAGVVPVRIEVVE